MFVWKTLSTLVWGGESQASVLVQSPGSFYSWGTSGWICRFNHCEASVRKTDEEYKYELVITRLDDEVNSNETVAFVCEESMAISTGKGLRDNYGFTFNANGTPYLFELDSSEMAQLMIVTIAQCMFEYKFKTPRSEATEEDILKFIHQQQAQTNSPAKATPTKQPTETKKKKTPKEEKVVPQQPAVPPKQDIKMTGAEVLRTNAKLFLFESSSQSFAFQQDVIAIINSTGDNKTVFKFWLFILATNGDLVVSQEVSNEMYAHFNEETKSVIWVYSLGKMVWTWSLVFGDMGIYSKYTTTFTRCLWETNSGKPFKVKDEELDWLVKGLDDVAIMEKDDDDDIREEDMREFESDEEEDETDEEEEEEDKEDDRNSQLAVGMSSDRTFVVRGSKIGIFSPTPDHKLKYNTEISRIKNAEGKVFSPRKLMLHQQDNSMLLLHPDDNKKIFKIDLGREDVVEEWKVSDHRPVNEIFPNYKYAQRTIEPTLLGLNEHGFLSIDPRLPKLKGIESQSRFYAPTTRAELKVAATTQGGQMVTGSKNGDIRLFNQKTLSATDEIGKAPRATTSLPGFGDPIIGIDVTADGKWVLATCKTYLLVVPTELKGGGLGFDKRMGAEKPAPRRLQLKREHIALVGGKVNFLPARFNTGVNMERSVVTSTGRFVITWNFRKVKQNKLNDYSIKELKQDVVDDQFLFNNDSSVVVAMPNNVTLAQKSVVKTFSPKK